MSLPTKHFCEFGPFRIDPDERVLYRDGRPVALPPKTFDTLAALVERYGHIVEKDELMRTVWPDTFVEEVNLARHVSNLRKVLGEDGDDNLYIETVPRRGYRFVAPVKMVPMKPVRPVEIDDGEELVVETHTLSRIVTNEEVIEPEAIETGQQPVAALSAGAGGLASSSIGGVKRHKPAAILALATVIAAGGFGLYRWLDRAPARPFVPPNIVPFASLPGREGEPDFSPDGKQLAFTWDGGEGGQKDIYVKLIGAGTPLRLTNDAADEVSPVWAPDGRHIAFVRNGQTQHQVLLVPALGGPERKILAGGKQISRLTWSPDGRWLAMAEAQDVGNNQRIVMVSVETGEKRPLTTPPTPANDYRPAFSPDGRQLAFVRDWDLYLTAVGGGDERRLTTGSRGIDGLAWTADGREIIYDSGQGGNRTLWRVPVAGGEPEALFSGGSIYSFPAIAKQGRQLAFVESYLDSNIRRLELPATALTSGRTGRGIAINWAAMTKLINSQREDDSPQFSPDGKKIAFASNRAGSMEIWVCPSDGGSPLQLTRMVTPAGSPRWSPDGRQLVYDAQQQMQGDLFVIDAEGGATRRLTTEPSADILPSWSRDGAWIYFCSNRSGNRQLWKMPAAGGPAVQLTRQGGFEAVEAPDGKTLYYSKGVRVNGLWTMPATGGAEQPVPELAHAGFWRSWTMTNDGIYFVANEGTTPPRPLKFFSFATRQVTLIGTVDQDPLWYVPGLAVSPDNRWLLYAQYDRNMSNIMLVENFR